MASTWRESMLDICPRTLSVPGKEQLTNRKSVSFEQQIMSKDKYASTFSKSNGGYCVYNPLNISRNTRTFESCRMF